MSNEEKKNQKPTKPRPPANHKASGSVGNESIALRYAQLRFRILPLHGIKGGSCTCGDPNCDQPGRHPRTVHGVREATMDPQLVREMFAKWPKARIGIALGNELLALATDDKAARGRLREIIATKEELPRTVAIRDHEKLTFLFKGHGSHFRKGDLADGVRILGEGDFIVAPSSFESAGKRHFATELSPEAVEIAQAPDWLLGSSAEKVKENDSAAVATGQVQPTIVVVPSSEIEPKPVQWLWSRVIASGRVTGLVGYPGLGKSQVAIDIAATISTGRAWPGEVANDSAGDVIILPAEDDLADTVVPRLMAAGADRNRIHLVKAVKEETGLERAFTLTLDLDRLEKECDLHQVKLVIIDPISGYLLPTHGKRFDRNNARDVRTLLARLSAFAEQHELGVLTISHLNKSNGTPAIARITGSQEWAAAPRVVFLVTEEHGTARRLFLPLKNNIAPDRVGYAFEIVDKIVDNGIRAPAVAWSSDPVTISADEALAAATKKVTSGSVYFVQEALSDGPMDQTEVVRRGREAGYTEKALRTAREKLNVMSKRVGGVGSNGKWVWELPGGAPVLKLAVDNKEDKKGISDTQQPGQSTEREKAPDGDHVA